MKIRWLLPCCWEHPGLVVVALIVILAAVAVPLASWEAWRWERRRQARLCTIVAVAGVAAAGVAAAAYAAAVAVAFTAPGINIMHGQLGAFQKLDADGDGFITLPEMSQVVTDGAGVGTLAGTLSRRGSGGALPSAALVLAAGAGIAAVAGVIAFGLPRGSQAAPAATGQDRQFPINIRTHYVRLAIHTLWPLFCGSVIRFNQEVFSTAGLRCPSSWLQQMLDAAFTACGVELDLGDFEHNEPLLHQLRRPELLASAVLLLCWLCSSCIVSLPPVVLHFTAVGLGMLYMSSFLLGCLGPFVFWLTQQGDGSGSDAVARAEWWVYLYTTRSMPTP
jgi:hypothetical protein